MDAGSDAALSDGSAADATDTAPPCIPSPRPGYVPAGWIPYDDYAPCSGLYMPTDASQLPSPIAWQACEATAGVAGCRRIQIDWAPTNELPAQIFIDTDATLDQSGSVIVLTSREFVDHKFDVIAYADGVVLAALLATQLSAYRPYVFLPPTFNATRWIVQIKENNDFSTSGYIAGTMSNVGPTAHGRFNGNHTNVVGDFGILDIANNAVIGVLDFDTGSTLLNIKSPSLPMSFEWMFHSSVFWQGNSGTINDVGRWAPDSGAVDFINYGFDPTHAAGDLGTDGVDMVWLEGHGSATDAGPYASVDYWTSPYVTTSSMLQPRRLRSETTTAILGPPIAVGCGRAAYAPAGLVNGLRIVRLSDGWSWYLPNVAGWNWQQALALTCNELFVRVYISGPITTLARISFSQLGPGVPPD